ncbi:MAG: transcription antitermination factor NusB [Eubacteriales bacterium]|nr:transcription antitermination factor NusB [Eubacteriales bacterium]
MTRHESRAAAFCLLFEYSFGGNPEEIITNAVINREEDISGFAKSLFLGTVGEIKKIDEYIAQNAEKRTFSRIGRVPLACLRLGAYELLYTETPPEIIIDEALELCREYNCDDSVSYVNGVLGRINVIKNENG